VPALAHGIVGTAEEDRETRRLESALDALEDRDAEAAVTVGEIRPTVKVRLRSRLWARSLGRKPRRSAAIRTAVRVSSRSWPPPFSALETVPTLTPANRATSRMVTGGRVAASGSDAIRMGFPPREQRMPCPSRRMQRKTFSV
jgi:hypothetical protein